MKIKNRIKELRVVPASELLPNPKNWRKHPEQQENALRSMLADVGFANAVIAKETDEGFMLLDGHLRLDVASDAEVPVLVVDLTEVEADKVLATLDPLASMAETSTNMLADLLEQIQLNDDGLSDLLNGLAGLEDNLDFSEDVADTDFLGGEKFEIVITCNGENHQLELLEKFNREGLKCHSLIS